MKHTKITQDDVWKHTILVGTPVKLIDNSSLDHLPLGIKGHITALTWCGNGDGYPADGTYQIQWENGHVDIHVFEMEIEVVK